MDDGKWYQILIVVSLLADTPEVCMCVYIGDKTKTEDEILAITDLDLRMRGSFSDIATGN